VSDRCPTSSTGCCSDLTICGSKNEYWWSKEVCCCKGTPTTEEAATSKESPRVDSGKELSHPRLGGDIMRAVPLTCCSSSKLMDGKRRSPMESSLSSPMESSLSSPMESSLSSPMESSLSSPMESSLSCGGLGSGTPSLLPRLWTSSEASLMCRLLRQGYRELLLSCSCGAS